MSIDHDRARELHATSLRALMENPPPTTATIRWTVLADPRRESRFVYEPSAIEWIDAVLAAWERGER